MIHPLIFFHAMNTQWSVGPYDLSTYHLIFAARSKWMLALCSLRRKDLCVWYCLHLLSLFNKRSLLELVRFAFRPRKDTPNPIPVHSSAFAGVPVWLCMFKILIVENKTRLQRQRCIAGMHVFMVFIHKMSVQVYLIPLLLTILKAILIKWLNILH